MAKHDFRWLTAPVTAYVGGLVDQQLLHQANVGHLGKLTPNQTQAAFGGVATVGAGLTRLLSRRESGWTRITEGILATGAVALGQTTMHTADQWMAKKASSSAPSSSSSTDSDASADASVTSKSADDTQDTTDSVSSATDADGTFPY